MFCDKEWSYKNRIENLKRDIHERDKEIKRLWSLLCYYRKLAFKNPIVRGEEEPIIYSCDDNVLCIVSRINSNLYRNKNFDTKRFLIKQASNSIKDFLNNPNNKKKIQELMGEC